MADATLRIKTVMDSGDVISNINQIQHKLESLKMPKDLTDKTKAKFDELTGVVKEYQNLLDKPHKSNADLRRLDQLSVEMKKIEKEAEKMIRSFDFKQIDTSEIDSSEIKRLKTELDEAYNSLKRIAKQSFSVELDGGKTLLNQLDEINAKIGKTKSGKTQRLFADLLGGIDTGNLQQITKATAELKKYLSSGGEKGPFQGAAGIKKSFEEVVPVIQKIIAGVSETSGELGQAKQRASGLEDELSQAIANRMTEMAKDAGLVATNLRDASSAADTYRNGINAAARQQTEMQQQVANLQQQVKNYFGLDEVFRKIGDLAREAMSTVKELDAAMTQTAVVTNFSVSDMWKMLPTYTKNANALGATISDVYNAATLYYQQGLTTTQSMALANETLKMARIGGIEAAEATDMMTAALRGFNMEINQTSAQRINDVYSKLAAITAADTKEIGTAMERTASIASSANMDFETTAAFLSQMIETTREAPENLGTAMKTIVARFQEMKVDPNTLIDSEGERLDFNRVDKALKSIGVSLVDENNQFRDLDDVFLEIASRWDGLSQAQQRYIATIAAGSRQQSRFIAMMQDYDRTLELVDAAYTAEGAGQAQFEKTLESMDSKLKKLKNAWDQFVMGLMNADFLKKGVDVATTFLDIFEKIITGFSKIGVIDPFQGVIKSALTATAVFGGLIGMSKLLMFTIGKFSTLVLGPAAAEQGGFFGAAASYAKGASSPEKQARRDRLKEERENRLAAARDNARLRNRSFDAGISSNREEGGKYFSNLKAGSQAQKEFKGFQKQIGQELAKGKIDLSFFKNSFSNASEGMKKIIGTELIEAAREGVRNSNFDDEIKAELLQKISAIEGDIDFDLEDKLKHISNIEAGNGKVGDLVDAEAAAKKLAPLEANFQKVGAGATRAGQAIQMFGANLQGTPLAPFGSALIVVGQGLQNIGMLMDGGFTAIKKWASSMADAGKETLKLGSNAGRAKQFFAGLGKSIASTAATLGPYLLVAAAVAAVIGLLVWSATKSSRELKRQGDAAAQAGQDLDTCKQALEALNNDLAELSNNDDALDNLVKGTTEWNSKLAEANAHIIEMMQNYSALNEIDQNTGEYKYVKTDESGRMSVTKEGQKVLQKEYQSAVNVATANNAIQGALYNNLKDLNSKEKRKNDVIIAQAEAYGIGMGSDEYKQAVAQNENIKKANEAREANAWKTGVHAVVNDLNLPNQDTVENILAGQKESLLEANKLDAITIGQRKDLEKEYAELMGYTRQGKNTYKDAQGNELTIDLSVVKEQLPELRTISDMTERAADTSSAIDRMDRSFTSFASSMDENGIDANLLSGIMADSAEVSADEIAKIMTGGEDSIFNSFIKSLEGSTNEQQWRQLELLAGLNEGAIKNADQFNKALEDYQSAIEEHAGAILETQNEYVSATAGLLGSINSKGIAKWTDPDKGTFRKGTKTQKEKTAFSYEEMGKIANIGDQIGDNLGEKSAQQFAKAMTNSLHKSKDAKNGFGYVGKSARELIEKELSGIDFSNSLQVIDAFNNLGDITGVAGAKGAREYSKEFKKSYEYSEQMASALQQVITSDDLAESLKDVKLDETNGQYTAQIIQEIAKNSQSLSTYLDSAKMSAGSFANILNKMGEADLDISDLTPGLVSFANAMDKVSQATGSALQSIQNFNAGDDLGSIDEFSQNAVKALSEMAENGEWGNTQMGGYFNNYFGPGAFEKMASDTGSYKKAYKKMMSNLKKITIDEGENAGQFDTDLGKGVVKGAKNTDEAIKKLQNKFKFLSEDAANQYLTAIINKSDKLGLRLRQGDNAEAYKEFRKTSQTLGEEYGKTYQINGEEQSAQIASLTDIFNIRDMLGDEDAKKFWKNVEEDYGKANKEQIKGLKEAYDKGDMEAYHEALKKATFNTEELSEQQKRNLANLITTNAASSKEEITNTALGIFGDRKSLQKTEEGYISLEKAAEAFTIAAGGDQNVGYDALASYITSHGLQGATFAYQGQTMTGQELLDEGIADKITSITDSEQWATVGKTMAESFANTLAMRTDKDGNTEFVTKGTIQAEEFTSDTGIKQDSQLFKWLAARGSASLNPLAETSNAADQAANRQLVTDFIKQLTSQQIEITESELSGLWSKIISQTGGEGLAVNQGKDRNDANTIQSHSEEYASLLGQGVTGKDQEAQTESLNNNLQALTAQMQQDSLTQGTQLNMLSTYLQQNATAFQQLDAEGQQQVLTNLAEQFKGFNADSFAAAINQALGTSFEGKNFAKEGESTVTPKLSDDSKAAIEEQLKGIEADITGNMTIKVVGTGARGINNTHFGTMARGSGHGYTIPGRPTLTGEDGEELVWEPKRNQAYMVGTNGPEFANISKDAVVWNAAQTRQIKKNSGSAGRFGTGSRGINNFGTMAEGTKIGPFSADVNAMAKSLEIPEGMNVPVDLQAKTVNPPEEQTIIPATANIENVTNKVKKAIKGFKGSATITSAKRGSNITGEPIKVKAQATVGSVDTQGAESDISNLQEGASSAQTMSVDANTTAADRAINATINKITGKSYELKYHASGPSSIEVPIKPDFRGIWEKTVTIKKGPSARGQNYQQYNSYARGRLPGSPGSAGMSLVGEEGYEVVWSPSENKAMIVGVDGPQMINLSKDSVVWPYEQSKKILKNNKGMPVGSFAKGNGRGITKSEKSEVKFFSWIDKIDSSQAKIDRWSKTIDRAKDAMDRYAADVGSSMKTLNAQIKKQSEYLAKQLSAAKTEEKYARKALNKIDKSQKKINVSYNKSASKKSKSADLYFKEGDLVKKGKDGYLTVNEKAIAKKARKKGTNAYQVNQIITELRSQAKSLADEYNGYLEGSKETIDEIKNKQRELDKNIQDMFFSYERSLTKIKEAQDRINTYDSFESKISSMQSLMEAQLKAGLSTSQEAVGQYIDLFNKHIDNLTHKIANQSFLVGQTARKLTEDLNFADEYNKYKAAKGKASKYKKGTAEYDTAIAEANYWKEQYDRNVLGAKYVSVKRATDTGALYVDVNVDALDKAQLTGEEYKAIEDYYNSVLQDIQDVNSQTADINSSIAGAYGELTDAYSEMDGYAKTIINGMQEEKQETIDSLKTLNDSIRDAFSELIDSVRKELDKQRKAEQNAKTEKDITNQMNRLAMLRADTSGSNAAQIAQLEKEIAEATGNYEDSLEDQMLDQLQEDADKAAEQRERQISILENELEYTKAIGQYVTEAERLIEAYINGDASAKQIETLRNYFMLGSGGKEAMTKWGEFLAKGEWESAATKMGTFNERLDTITKTIEKLKDTLDEINNINPSLAREKVNAGGSGGKGSAQSTFDNAYKTKKDVAAALKEVKSKGFTAKQAAKIKYTDSKGQKQNVSASQLLKGGYSSKQVAEALPNQPKHVVKAVAKVKGQAGLSNLDGMQYGKVDVNGSKKGGVVKDSHVETHTTKNGKEVSKITTNKGSTLYVTKLDSKTGQPVGKYTAIPIDKLTESQVKEYTDAKQALKYAITHTNPGKKINKNFEKLAEAAGFVGKGFKLNNKTTAHIGGDGTIHYSGTKDKELGVYVWDPSAGSKKFRKYDKGKFKDWAKSTNVGMEYKAVLKKKGVKGYATGGLADYTGPAWMDGTPSKPELVLNATDTKNFVALKDVLSEAAKRGMFNHEESNSTGDMTFDININVDKIDSDYDVEQVAKKVEKIIVTKAKHRNVTVTGRTR